MKIERLKLSPEQWVDQVQQSDCFWISFKERKRLSPLASSTLQHIDWRLQGLLSHFVMQQASHPSLTTTFVPVKNRLPFDFLALEAGRSPDWKLIEKNCLGQRWNHLTLFFEDGLTMVGAEKELRKFETKEYPRLMRLASDT